MSAAATLHTPALGIPAAFRHRRPRAADIATVILLGGVIARLATLAVPHFFFADEIFQYLEPAHRLAFGHGIVTWEYRTHARSWLFPLLLAGPMRAGALLAPDSAAYLLLPKLLLLGLSLLSIWAAAWIGRGVSALHALFAMLIAAIWFEAVYFSTQALTEAAAVPIFLAGAALLYANKPRTDWAAGALLASSALLRFQYGPAMGLFTLCVVAREPRRLWRLAASAVAALTGSACVDLAVGDKPFGWLAENFHQNIGLGRSHTWVSGPFFYPHAIADLWGIWLVPVAALGLIGARRFPALAACAVMNVLAHSLIAHKEYRYILLSTMILALLAAIGTADALLWLRRRLPGSSLRRLSLGAGATWLIASAAIAGGSEVRLWWVQGTPQLRAFDALRRLPALCGVALFRVPWASTGGYAYLHRTVPLHAYDAAQAAMLAREAGQFDAIVAPRGADVPHAFTPTGCFAAAGSAATCTFVRAGGCAPARSRAEINRLLVRLDQ